jgi:hypothetical protein
VALGLALAVIAGTWIAMLDTSDVGGGWFAYAHGTPPIFPDRPSHALADGAIALGAVALWVAISYRLLRTRSASPSTDE